MGQIVFFVPYLSIAASNHDSVHDLFSVGKTMFIAIIGKISVPCIITGSGYWLGPVCGGVVFWLPQLRRDAVTDEPSIVVR